MARRERPEVRGVGRAGEAVAVVWKPKTPPRQVLCDEKGYLHCETCGALNAIWCQHIQEWIVTGADGEWQLWGIPAPGHDERIIAVPLFPNSGDVFWAFVWLVPTEREYVWNAALDVHDDYGVLQREHLGTLGPGDGRNAARDMTFNFMMSSRITLCRQRTHKYQQVKGVRQLEPGSVEYLQNRWLELTQKCCVFCWQFVAASRGWSEWTPASMREI